MDPRNQLTTLRSLFDELVELGEADRSVRLREIGTRDEALRNRLEAMLVADANSGVRFHEYARAARSLLAGTEHQPERDPLGLTGSTVGRYRIDDLLGAGGMGVVYRATDLRLGRVAALKFLPPAWSLDTQAKERFLREARAASSLDHANVCTIYEADETADSTLYIAMAFYEGETLRARLERGPLAAEAALDLAAQVARGLAAAHGRGLVHRDIKPANLLVTPDGVLKILDFGVAKAADVGLTSTEQRPGTAAYMAPEQARGEAVDGRADLWSLGVVLYELLTARRPASVAGASSGGERVVPPSTVRAGVPEWADALVVRLLAHDPDERPTADEIVDLRARQVGSGAARADQPSRADHASKAAQATRRPWRGRRRLAVVTLALVVAVSAAGWLRLREGDSPDALARTTLQTRIADLALAGRLEEAVELAERMHGRDRAPSLSITVLPFDDRSADSGLEHLAQGFAEEILNALASIDGLRVASPTSASQLRAAGMSLRELGRELDLDAVLEGSVRSDGDRLRITARLVSATDDSQLWSDAFDGHANDVFALQEEIARAVAGELELGLPEGGRARLLEAQTEQPEAYEIYLKGRLLWSRRTIESMTAALEYFRRAIEVDSSYARAHAGMADAYFHLNHFGAPAAEDWVGRAQALVSRALELDPTLGEAHASLGLLQGHAGQWRLGEVSFRTAAALDPDYGHAVTWVSFNVMNGRGDLAEAFTWATRAYELDPFTWIPVQNYARLLLYRGDVDEAISVLERNRTVNGDVPGVHALLAAAYTVAGRHDDAVRSALEAVRLAPEDPLMLCDAADALALAGDVEHARDLIDRAQALAAPHFRLGLAFGLLGELDEAFAWLEAGGWRLDDRVIVEFDPRYDAIRADRRWPAILEKLKEDLSVE